MGAIKNFQTYFFSIFLLGTVLVIAGTSFADQNRPVFNKAEKRWIAENPVVNFTGDPNWLPYEAFNKDGVYIGIVAEHLKLIENITGLTFKTKQPKNWTASLQLAMTGKVSVISGDAADTILNKRFSPVKPYIHNAIVIIMNVRHNYIENLNEISNRKIAIIKDYGYTADIFKTYPDIQFSEVENIQQGLLGVSDGRYDAMLATLALASYTITDLGIHNIKIVGKTPIVMDLTLFIDKSQPELHSIIDKAVRSITKLQSHEIIKKWTTSSYLQQTDYSLVLLVIISAVLLISIFAFWNLRLSDEISLREAIEIENQQTEARFEAMFQSLPEGIIYAGADRRIRLMNKSAEKLFGYTIDELEGKLTKTIYASEQEFKHQGNIRYNGSSKLSNTPYTVTYRKKNNTLFDGETLSTMVCAANGELIGYLAIIRDISERSLVDGILRSLAASSSTLEFNDFLKETLLRLSELYNCKYAFAGLLQADKSSIQTLCILSDKQVIENFSYSLDGTPCMDIMNQEIEIIPQDATSHYPNDTVLAEMEIEGYFGAPLISSDKNVIGLISIMDTRPLSIDEWTEPVLGVFATRISLELERNQAIESLQKHREQLEEQVKIRTADLSKARDDAERANASKSEFLSRMSHELRTPMNAILGFGQILEHNASKHLSETELGYVKEVLKGGYHLLELINEVLDLSRVESGKLQLSQENFNLGEVINEAISLITPLADASNIKIILPEEKLDCCVHSDRMRIKQIILNLLSNAVKYNQHAGQVEISCKSGDRFLALHFRDTGTGIPKEIHDRVFEPFDRLNANTSEIEGTGIGLSLSKKMIEMMGGKIGFNSLENIGSDFWIEIPLAVTTAETDQDPVTQTLQSVSENQNTSTLLYVEDNPANLRLVSQILKNRGGISLYNAHTASIAIDLLTARQFDLILLDIHLPGAGDGYDVLRKIRSMPETRQVPVIAVSANATEHDIKQGLQAGFDAYITKPIDIEIFLETVNKFLPDQAASSA